MTGFRRLVAVGTPVNRRSLSAAATTKTKENPMKSIVFSLLTVSLLLSAAMAGETGPSTGAVAKDVPFGHKDFYPSPQRPVGDRGDWTGVFPGAKGVALEWDHRTGKNIIWKCRLPYWSNSAPIVVGKRAFVGSEPDELICVDTETGAILWKRSIFIDQFIPEADRAGVRKALREGNDEALLLDIPGHLWPERWLKAIEPSADEAMAETARRIAEIQNALKAKGLLSGPGQPKVELRGVQTGFPTPEGIALLEKHKIIDWGRDQKKYSPFPHGCWGYHLGFTMPSPCSDGKHLWYQTSLGAIACLDLDGKVVWAKRMGTVGPTTSMFFRGGGSPVLIKDRLYYHDHIPKAYGIVAVDKDTGKEIWRRPRGKADNDHWQATDGYYGARGRGSSGMVPLRLEDRDFIVTPGRYILDAATGATVGDLGKDVMPYDMRRAHTVNGSSLFLSPPGRLDHFRLRVAGDKITTELMWSGSGSPGWNLAIVWQGWVYVPGHFDSFPLTGHPLDRPNNSAAKPELLGKQGLFKGFRYPNTEMFFKHDRREGHRDEWLYSTASVAEGHLFVGNDINGMQVYKLDGEKTVAVHRNFMDLWIRANPFFQGNRMYVRTFHYLYCIGVKHPEGPHNGKDTKN